MVELGGVGPRALAAAGAAAAEVKDPRPHPESCASHSKKQHSTREIPEL